MIKKDVFIDDQRFTFTQLSNFGYGINIRSWKDKIDKDHFVVKTVHSVFEKTMHYFPHTPLVIGEVSDEDKFSAIKGIRVLDCPIKFPGSNDYKMPRDLHQFDEVISKVISFEHAINPDINDYYAYLTIDQDIVNLGSSHRNPICHTNGFQGARHTEKKPITRSYMVYDCVPNIFYAQGFRVSYLSDRSDDIRRAFEYQSSKSNEVFFDPYKIILTNAYTVHKSGVSELNQHRTFFRLSFDTNKYDRLGNTHNPLFDYHWSMVVRNPPAFASKKVVVL